MQALSQMSPVSNIGMVIWQSATPDVGTNPIFARCIWADTTLGATNVVFKFWNGAAWQTAVDSDDSITNPDAISDDVVSITKLLQNEGGVGFKGYVLHQSKSTGDLEYVAPTNLFTAGQNEVKLTYLDVAAGTSGQFLQIIAGSPAWTTFIASQYITNLPVANLLGAAQGAFLQTDASGIPVWNATPVLPNASVGIAKIDGAGTASGQVLRATGTAWTNTAPSIDIFAAAYSADAAGTWALGLTTITSGLTTVPKMWKVVAVCTADDATPGYVEGDEVDLNAFTGSTGSTPKTFAFFDTTTKNFKVDSLAISRSNG